MSEDTPTIPYDLLKEAQIIMKWADSILFHGAALRIEIAIWLENYEKQKKTHDS